MRRNRELGRLQDTKNSTKESPADNNMAAAEVDVLQLADRPWAEISAIRLTGTPAPLPPPPLPEDDSVQCDFRTLLFVHDGPVPPFADCDIRGRPAHRVFTQGVRRHGALPAAYGRRGAVAHEE